MSFYKYLTSFVFLISIAVFAQTEATKLKIEEITVNKMSFVNSEGISWDRNSGPDIYIELKDYRDNVIESTRSNKLQDVTQAELPLKVRMNNSYIYQLNAPFTITLKDADAFSDDVIKIIQLTPTSFIEDTTNTLKPFQYLDEKEITDLEIKFNWEK